MERPRAAAADPGIGGAEIEPPEAGDNIGNSGLDRVLAGNVDLLDQHCAAMRAQRGLRGGVLV